MTDGRECRTRPRCEQRPSIPTANPARIPAFYLPLNWGGCEKWSKARFSMSHAGCRRLGHSSQKKRARVSFWKYKMIKNVSTSLINPIKNLFDLMCKYFSAAFHCERAGIRNDCAANLICINFCPCCLQHFPGIDATSTGSRYNSR